MRDPANGLLSERLEHLSSTRLGFIQKYVPTDEEIEAAIVSGEKRAAIEGSQTVLLLDDEVTDAGVHVDATVTVLRTCAEVAPADYRALRDRVLSASSHLREAIAYRSAGVRGVRG